MIKEADMYEPIKNMLHSLGFISKGEVKNCDIAAIKGDELWVIEMKLQLTLKLLYQAMSRKSITNNIFVAIPRPKKVNKNFRSAVNLIKKLELGLITVALDSPVPFAEILLFPAIKNKTSKKNKKSEAVRREIKNRVSDTPGGSNRIKITTAYRERCIKIACMLSRLGESDTLSPKELVRDYNCSPDTGSILLRNYYKWFKRVSRGRYKLSDIGLKFLEENSSNPVVLMNQLVSVANQLEN